MIEVTGNNVIVTKDHETAYRVVCGDVLVFIVPYFGEEAAGRRVLAYEARKGEVIPSLCVKEPLDIDDADPCQWHFVLSTTDSAQLETVPCTEEVRNAFIEKCDLESFSRLHFDLVMVEFYKLCITKEVRNTVTADKESREAQHNSFKEILQLFDADRSNRRSKTSRTGNALYDALSRLCDWQLIEHVSLDKLQAACGNKITVEDYARLSGFSCRKIVLTENWYQKNAGPFLCYIENKKHPAAVLPDKGGGYRLYDPETDTMVPVTRKVADTLMTGGYMCYRPLPERKLGLRDLIRFTMEDLRTADIIFVLLLVLIETLIGLLLPFINEKVYDLFIPLGDSGSLFGVCMVLIACTISRAAFVVIKSLISFRDTSRLKYSMQAAVYHRLYSLPMSFFRKYESAELAERVMAAGTIFDTLERTVLLSFPTMLFGFLYLFRMRRYSKRMTKTGLIVLLVFIVILLFLGYAQSKHEKEIKSTENKMSSVLYQLIGGIAKLRIAGAEKRGIFRYMHLFTENSDAEMRVQAISRWSSILSTSMAPVSSIIFYYIMIHHNLSLSIGNFMAYTSAFSVFANTALQFVNGLIETKSLIPMIRNLRPVLEAVPEKTESGSLPGELTGKIELNNVTFGYQPDRPVIRNMNLTIRAGEYVGVVGASGCGKSTLLKLLLGFESPQTGKIFYDSKDIDSLDKRELRKKFGVVLQNGDTISGSIYDNITITNPNVSLKKVNQAVDDTGLRPVISQMPMGLNTVLSEGGGGVSGGQKQRILIARAIVNDPCVLFFDEATSALDNRTQEMICRTIEKLSCTKIVIAHRLSTIINCDRILVMREGVIEEEGSYTQLMEKKGLFYELAKRQQ